MVGIGGVTAPPRPGQFPAERGLLPSCRCVPVPSPSVSASKEVKDSDHANCKVLCLVPLPRNGIETHSLLHILKSTSETWKVELSWWTGLKSAFSEKGLRFSSWLRFKIHNA